MAGNVGIKIVILTQKIQLHVAKDLDLVLSLGTADHRTNGEKQNIPTIDVVFYMSGGSRERSINGA